MIKKLICRLFGHKYNEDDVRGRYLRAPGRLPVLQVRLCCARCSGQTKWMSKTKARALVGEPAS